MPTADELLGPDVLSRLIDVLDGVRPGHPFAALESCRPALAADAPTPLALRERSDLLKDALLADVPGSAAEFDAVVRGAMGDARFTGWMIWPITEAVTARTLESRAPAASGAPGAAGHGPSRAARTGNQGSTGNAAVAGPIRAARTGNQGSTGNAAVAGPIRAARIDAKGSTAGDGSPLAADRDFDAALELLAALTPRLTAEFAIRPLLQADLARALPIIQSWVTSPDPHVRRLASEGTRSFLPWAKRVPALLADPYATVPIISAMYRDESDYVRRSVANHLNDLSRQSPDLAAQVAAEWMLAPDENTARVVRHGLRSLVKKGHGPTLALFGFDPQHGVTVVGPVLGVVVDGAGAGAVVDGAGAGAVVDGAGAGAGIDGAGADGGAAGGAVASRAAASRTAAEGASHDIAGGGTAEPARVGVAEVAIGGELPFSVTLENTTATPATLVIDYIVQHRKANGTQTAKVFKLATTTLAPGERVSYARRHSFRRITTRVYHPGEHALEVQVNGVASGRVPFVLLAD
ncbi:hypothetical protein [Subtercola endophyticus]|uniref:hypothetical protein n=1 Tax=Subtercola endophyticus TaxID=2895559 RepID=UPI001E2AE1FC|nr:hypothetical protein [Subtercola endophyticus]UFS58472.1 hypothetical protein LQ955_15925 [Subtercola endophyticus]